MFRCSRCPRLHPPPLRAASDDNSARGLHSNSKGIDDAAFTDSEVCSGGRYVRAERAGTASVQHHPMRSAEWRASRAWWSHG